MQWVSTNAGKLIFESESAISQEISADRIIELIAETPMSLQYPALWLAIRSNAGALVWCNQRKPPYAPALLQQTSSPVLWVRGNTTSAAECLRSKGVGAVILQPRKLSAIEARRLQLAAEHGGGIGILLRDINAAGAQFSASARYLVKPARGDELTQRWHLTLIHGHGRHVGETVTLELSRETNHLHLSSVSADRSNHPKPAVATG